MAAILNLIEQKEHTQFHTESSTILLSEIEKQERNDSSVTLTRATFPDQGRLGRVRTAIMSFR